jgi:Cu+-exporting ATPase
MTLIGRSRGEDGTTLLAVEGMSCAACVGRVERALKAVPGVTGAEVNLATRRATLRHSGGAAVAGAAATAATKAGYAARPVVDEAAEGRRERESRAAEERALGRAFAVAAAATLPLVAIEMGAHLSGALHHALAEAFGEGGLGLVALLLASLVQFGPGLQFYRKGGPALLRGAPDMNSLVMLGTTTAYAWSLAALLWPELVPAGRAGSYFESGAVIVTLVLAGRWLEARARGRTGEAIRRLMGLQPRSARILRDGAEREVAVAEVVPGDIVILRPGERVPVDGIVVDGASFVDEAMISGEPAPVRKSAGDEAIGGTVNGTGSLRLRATRVGSETLLSQIARMVAAAQGGKLPIQALVDRVTLWFVPAVLAAALATFLAWFTFGPQPALGFAVVNAVAVLIIACPCAMGLATPTSIMVGTGRAAGFGVLFRRGDALQALRDTTVVALDKTGTLTEGRPALTDLLAAAGFDADAVLRLAASVESRSEHPVALAIGAEAKRRGLALAEVEGFAAEPGFGVAGMVEGRRVLVGSARLAERESADLAAFGEAAERLAEQAATPLHVLIDGEAAALIGVADPVKQTTPAALASLRRLGLRLVMVTGDARATAEAVARRLGIDEVVAEVLPADKAAAITRLQGAFGKVAFVGDGINDAPALAQADVGLAIGTGTDIAIESADVVLISGDLRNVANAIALSRATLRNIAQNLGWAFGYNVLLIPVAAGALYPAFGILMSPVFAGLAMALSSVSVLANALRLRGFEPQLPASGETTP